MPNMSYCRFQNTSNDLRDCVESLSEALDEGKSLDEFFEEIGKSEQFSLQYMRSLMDKFIEFYDELESNNV